MEPKEQITKFHYERLIKLLIYELKKNNDYWSSELEILTSNNEKDAIYKPMIEVFITNYFNNIDKEEDISDWDVTLNDGLKEEDNGWNDI